MSPTEPKRNFLQNAVYSFFALFLGITPPPPGQEGFYATLFLALVLVLIVGGYFVVRFLLGLMLN
jgi:hypothetical protein